MVQLQKSTQELICQSIRSRIQAGTLAPGTELKQVDLAKEYGVSRMPVREALQTLLLEGLLTRLSNRHMVIAQDAPQHLAGKELDPVTVTTRPETASLNYKQNRTMWVRSICFPPGSRWLLICGKPSCAGKSPRAAS